MTCETRHLHKPSCLDWLDEFCSQRTCHNMILYFMADASRARLWTGAMKLAHIVPRLHELNTTVILVVEAEDGDDSRLGAVARLAEALGLPFPLIADSERTLWRRYAAAFEPAERGAGLSLVDGCGRLLDSWPLQAPEQTLDLRALLVALEALAAQ